MSTIANSYPIRALTTKGKMYYFTVRDVPVILDDDRFILMNKPDSPILLLRTITRGCDLNVFNGDIVTDGVETYYIHYSRGMIALGDSSTKLLSELENMEILGNVFQPQYMNRARPFAKNVQLKYRDMFFTIRNIYGVCNGLAMIKSIQEYINPEDIQQSAGFKYENKIVFFGDRIEGKEVIMKYGRPCIKLNNNKYLDITRGSEIGGKSK